ncbi:MAG TPA: hypothetical protein VMU96_06990 [Casimicrobiaceae bacterium]|nr:hypothetical protein [Casimicrobiaceae bacterium]
MQTKQIESVIATMNDMERARALQGMHAALLIERLFSAVASGVRRGLRSAGRAMTLAYGRGYEH